MTVVKPKNTLKVVIIVVIIVIITVKPVYNGQSGLSGLIPNNKLMRSKMVQMKGKYQNYSHLANNQIQGQIPRFTTLLQVLQTKVNVWYF